MTPIKTDIGAWPSMKAAAEAYGVSVDTIEYHLNRGTLDRIGKRSRRRPCNVGGVTYPTIADAARAAGISREAMRQRVERQARKGKPE